MPKIKSVAWALILTLTALSVLFYVVVYHHMKNSIPGVLPRSVEMVKSSAVKRLDGHAQSLSSANMSDAHLETNFSSLTHNKNNSRESEIRDKLKNLGYEPAEDHEFKSPYIITPRIHPEPQAESPGGVARKIKVIACWNCRPWFIRGGSYYAYNRDFRSCPYRECRFERDKRKSQEADMLIFDSQHLHGRLKPPRPRGQIWVKFCHEPPPRYYYPANYSQWANVFNWTFTYRVDSDIFAPYDMMAWKDKDQLLDDDQYLAIAKNKTRTASWLVSHCWTQSKRERYARKLKKYIDVDIYGRCGRPCSKHPPNGCNQVVTTSYKFYFAFENSLCKDYATEKLFNYYLNRTHIIPVVRGGFDYNKYLPPGTFVNAANFPNARSLAEHLKQLSNDPKRYAAMLKEKDKVVSLVRRVEWCDICKKLHTDSSTKIIPDIKKWSHTNVCHGPTDLG